MDPAKRSRLTANILAFAAQQREAQSEESLKEDSLTRKNEEARIILKLSQELNKLQLQLKERTKQLEVRNEIMGRYRHLLSSSDRQQLGADDTPRADWDQLRKQMEAQEAATAQPSSTKTEATPAEETPIEPAPSGSPSPSSPSTESSAPKKTGAAGIFMRAMSRAPSTGLKRAASVASSSISVTDEDPPAKFIEALRQDGLANNRVVGALKRALDRSEGDFVFDFLDQGGLGAIQLAITKFEAQRGLALDQLVCETQLVYCVKSLMNSESGLEAVISQDSSSLGAIVVAALKSQNSLMKTQVVALIAAVAIYSNDGFKLVLDVLEKKVKPDSGGRHYFVVLVEALSREHDAALRSALLSLINAVILKHLDVEQRIKMRQQLIDLTDFVTVVSRFKEEFAADRDLQTQVEVFEKASLRDNQEFEASEMIDGTHLKDPKSVFEAVLKRATGSNQEEALLTILQMLLLIPPGHHQVHAAQWAASAKAITHIATLSTADEIHKYTVSQLRDAIANIKTEPTVVPAAANQDPAPAAGAPPPPPPPPAPPAAPSNEGDSGPPPPPPPAGGPPPPPPPPGAPAPPPPPAGGPPPPPGPPGGPPPPPGGKMPPPIPGAPAKRGKPAVKPGKKMKAFYWATIPANKLPEYWKGVDDSKIAVDAAQVEELFSEKEKVTKAPTGDKSGKEEVKKPTTVALLDSKRANNVSIVRTQFKQTNEELRQQIVEMHDNLSLENLEALLKYAPEPEEIEVLRSYTGELELLGPSEKFFMMLISIPKLDAKLRSSIFKKEFDTKLAKLDSELRTMRLALRQLLESSKFKSLLSHILAVGNYVNGSTSRGGAYGFKLVETLPKLRDFKSNKPNVTLQHYIAEFIEKSSKEDADWFEELTHVEAATQLSLAQLQSDVQSFEQKTDKLLKDLEVADDKEEFPKFYSAIDEFSRRAAYEVEKLRNSLQRVEEMCVDVLKSFPNKDETTVEETLATVNGFISSYKAVVDDTKKRNEIEEKKRQLAEKKAKLEAMKAEKGGSGAATPVVTEQKPEVPQKSVDELKEERVRRRAARARGDKTGGGILDNLLESMKSGNFDSFVEQI